MNEQPQIFLGIDPGTKVTGYGIISYHDNHYIALDYGCIRPPAHLKLSERCLIIDQALEELLSRYELSALVLETQFVGKNPHAALVIGIARGVAMIAAKRKQKQLPVFAYAPSKVKQAVVGNGRASKQQVQYMIQSLLRLPSLPQPDDAADALALAICHAQTTRFPKIRSCEI